MTLFTLLTPPPTYLTFAANSVSWPADASPVIRPKRPALQEVLLVKVSVEITVNGKVHNKDVEPRQLLVHFIRDTIGLTGAKVGCDTSQCGSCTIIMDGVAVKSCTALAVQADGASITTIVGLAPKGGLHPLQEAFWNKHGLQCGFCTPGMIIAAHELLRVNPTPTPEEIRHGLEGNMCRCTSYVNIVRAVQEAAKVLASTLGTDLIRLQCYEGLDASHAVYEWNYARQLLEIRLREAANNGDGNTSADELFSYRFLIERPLLQAIDNSRERPPVLLIDEIDRADEEFEGFLLELLSYYQVTIPELGTVRAEQPPIVIITSNRTREVHDALKRCCLYFWIEYPDFRKELQIVTTKVPEASRKLAEQVTSFVQELRSTELYKVAGVAETLDWTAALVALDQKELEPSVIDDNLGILLKYHEDVEAVRGEPVKAILDRVRNPAARRGRRR